MVIWSDIDRLDALVRAAANSMQEQLAQTNVRQLNHPVQSLQRYELLRRLSDAGINNFRAFRLDEIPDDLCFPAFIRAEAGAAAQAPRLLYSRAELDTALVEATKGSAGGGLIIVEVGTEPGLDGYYRKYGAYRVGELVYPQHLFLGKTWFVKHPATILKGAREANASYVSDNPHAKQLMRIFDLARIDYGRIDYGVVRGKLQVFEINTNPAILSDPPTRFDRYDGRPYAQRHAEALHALHASTVSEDNSVEDIEAVHREIMRELISDSRRRQRRVIAHEIKDRLLLRRA